MHKVALLASTVVVSLVALAGTAAAQTYAPPPAYPPGYVPEVHEHDGLFFRVFLGLGYTRASSGTEVAGKPELSGPGGAFGVALGYTVSPNLVLYGEVFDDISVSPT